METKVNSTIAFLVGLVLLVAQPGAADTEGRPAGADRWVPWIGATGGLEMREIQGSVSSLSASGVDVGESRKDEAYSVTPHFGALLGAMSPEFGPDTLPARGFIELGFLAQFAADRDVAKEGSATGLIIPLTRPDFGEQFIAGEGSYSRGRVSTASYTGAIGLAFPIEVMGKSLRIKPSANYYRFSMDFKGRVLRAYKPSPIGRNFRAVDLIGNHKETFDMVGTGLEVEMDAYESDPIAVSIFVSGSALWLLGDNEATWSDFTTISDSVLPTDSYGAFWRYEVDNMLWRAGLGIRLLWIGDRGK